MKEFKTLTWLFLLFASTFSLAQSGVNVTYYDGTVQVFSVASSGKLYFESDNLYVKVDAATTPTTIPASIIRKITFSSTPLGTSTFDESKNHMVLYPNPGSVFIRIKSDGSDDLKIKIYALTGQLVQQGVYRPNQDIDISTLNSGLYLVQVNGLTIKLSKK